VRVVTAVGWAPSPPTGPPCPRRRRWRRYGGSGRRRQHSGSCGKMQSRPSGASRPPSPSSATSSSPPDPSPCRSMLLAAFVPCPWVACGEVEEARLVFGAACVPLRSPRPTRPWVEPTPPRHCFPGGGVMQPRRSSPARQKAAAAALLEQANTELRGVLAEQQRPGARGAGSLRLWGWGGGHSLRLNPGWMGDGPPSPRIA